MLALHRDVQTQVQIDVLVFCPRRNPAPKPSRSLQLCTRVHSISIELPSRGPWMRRALRARFRPFSLHPTTPYSRITHRLRCTKVLCRSLTRLRPRLRLSADHEFATHNTQYGNIPLAHHLICNFLFYYYYF